MLKLLVTGSFILYSFIGLIAQSGTPVTVDGQVLYRKSVEKLTKNSTHCIWCEDKKLSRNCREFVCDQGGQCHEFGISIADLKKIIRDGSTSKVPGFERVTIDGSREKLSFIEDDEGITFILIEGKNITLERHSSPSFPPKAERGQLTTTVFKEASPGKLKSDLQKVIMEIQAEKMKSASKNAEVVKQLL